MTHSSVGPLTVDQPQMGQFRGRQGAVYPVFFVFFVVWRDNLMWFQNDFSKTVSYTF